MVSDKLAKQKPELGKEYAKESGRKMIVSIRKEFGSRFIVSDNENFSRIIDSNPDLIEEHFEAKSGEDVSNVDVFKLK
jgi:hypothetical protein